MRELIKTRISSPSTDTSSPSKDPYRSFKSQRRVSSVKITKGLIHTWWLGTSAWVLAQNGVVFTLWVPDIWLWAWLLYFALSDAILKHELSSENKAVDFPKLTKIVCTQGPSAHLCARVQGQDLVDLVLGHRYRGRILAWVLDTRVCSH